MKNYLVCIFGGIRRLIPLLLLGIMSVTLCKAQVLHVEEREDSVGVMANRMASRMNNSTGYAPQMLDIIQPSPISRNFTRYANFTPNLSTGTVNVPIPLYELKLGDFTLPLSLQYATNGIKVYDVPFPAGYGWSLQPALRASRVVLGRPDDCYPRLTYSYNLPRGQNVFLESVSANNNHTGSRDGDVQHDVFTVNLPHESFNFIIDWNNFITKYRVTAVGTTDEVTIATNYEEYSGIRYIRVQDEKGIVYFFGNIDNSEIGHSPVEFSNGNVSTSWGLSEIWLPGKQGKIKFHWSNKTYPAYFPVYSEAYYYYDAWSNPSLPNNLLADSGARQSLEFNSSNYDLYMALDRIEYFVDKGINNVDYQLLTEVLYDYDEDFLSKIKIVDSESNQIVKEIKFMYDKKDCLLTSLNVSGEGTYSFAYNLDRIPLRKIDAGRDYWGFYNGQKAVMPQVPKTDVISNAGINSYKFEMGKSDMEPNEKYAQANLLTKVTYPTGGTSTFEYEMHRFDGAPQQLFMKTIPSFTKGGGVRIKRIVDNSGNEYRTIIKEYEYGENQNGKGFAVAEPTRESFFSTEINHFYENGSNSTVIHNDRRKVTLNSFSSYSDFLVLGQPIVWYNEVNEYRNSMKTERITYKYKYETYATAQDIIGIGNPISFWHNVPTYGFPSTSRMPAFLNTITSPLLKEQIFYKGEYRPSPYGPLFTPIKKKLYEYEYASVQNKELKVKRNIVELGENLDGSFRYDDKGQIKFLPRYCIPAAYSLFSDQVYSAEYYWLILAKEYLTKESTVYYEKGDSISTQTMYRYLNGSYKADWDREWAVRVLKEKTMMNSALEVFKETYLYPWEDLSDLTSEQKNDISNIISIGNVAGTPIRFQQYKDEVLTSQKTIHYKYYLNRYIRPEKEYFKTGKNEEEPRLCYDYDQYGNPVCVTADEAMNIIYLWSYSGRYPIAEIKNATYSEVETAVRDIFSINSVNELSCKSFTNEDQAALISQLKRLREHVSLKYAQMTSYTYKPLVGITSITDPSGKTITYEYDTFNRLLQIRDHDGNMIEKYTYNYVNQ